MEENLLIIEQNIDNLSNHVVLPVRGGHNHFQLEHELAEHLPERDNTLGIFDVLDEIDDIFEAFEKSRPEIGRLVERAAAQFGLEESKQFRADGADLGIESLAGLSDMHERGDREEEAQENGVDLFDLYRTLRMREEKFEQTFDRV